MARIETDLLGNPLKIITKDHEYSVSYIEAFFGEIPDLDILSAMEKTGRFGHPDVLYKFLLEEQFKSCWDPIEYIFNKYSKYLRLIDKPIVLDTRYYHPSKRMYPVKFKEPSLFSRIWSYDIKDPRFGGNLMYDVSENDAITYLNSILRVNPLETKAQIKQFLKHNYQFIRWCPHIVFTGRPFNHIRKYSEFTNIHPLIPLVLIDQYVSMIDPTVKNKTIKKLMDVSF